MKLRRRVSREEARHIEYAKVNIYTSGMLR